MNFRRGRVREEPEINLIALIDVLMVILIFLLVTTTWQRYAALRVNLPEGQGSVASATPHVVVVSVAADGRMAVDKLALPANDQQGLLAALRALPTDSNLVIQADGKATHQSVVDVLEAARTAGLTRLTFATRTPVS